MPKSFLKSVAKKYSLGVGNIFSLKEELEPINGEHQESKYISKVSPYIEDSKKSYLALKRRIEKDKTDSTSLQSRNNSMSLQKLPIFDSPQFSIED